MEEQFIENLDFASPETFTIDPEPEPDPKPAKPKKEPKAKKVEKVKEVEVREDKPVIQEEQQGYGYKRFKQKMGR